MQRADQHTLQDCVQIFMASVLHAHAWGPGAPAGRHLTPATQHQASPFEPSSVCCATSCFASAGLFLRSSTVRPMSFRKDSMAASVGLQGREGDWWDGQGQQQGSGVRRTVRCDKQACKVAPGAKLAQCAVVWPSAQHAVMVLVIYTNMWYLNQNHCQLMGCAAAAGWGCRHSQQEGVAGLWVGGVLGDIGDVQHCERQLVPIVA